MSGRTITGGDFMAEKPSVWNFTRAFRKHLFAAMSGGFSVPFTAAAALLDNKYAQFIFGILAFSSAWFAAYTIWKSERERVIELEERLGPSKKQTAVDDLSRELHWAIDNLLHRKPPPKDGGYWKPDAISVLKGDIDDWHKKIAGKLLNREVFSESDGIHFGVLGFVDPILVTGYPDLDKHLGMLRIKFERLRDIIEWRQP